MPRLSNVLPALVLALAGCAAGSDGFHLVSGMITTGGPSMRVEEVPMDSIRLRDELWVITKVSWEPETLDTGPHAVQWNVSTGASVVYTDALRVNLNHSPYAIWHRTLPGVLGPGHYSVEVLIDGELIDTESFEITP